MINKILNNKNQQIEIYILSKTKNETSWALGQFNSLEPSFSSQSNSLFDLSETSPGIHSLKVLAQGSSVHLLKKEIKTKNE